MRVQHVHLGYVKIAFEIHSEETTVKSIVDLNGIHLTFSDFITPVMTVMKNVFLRSVY